MNIAGRIKALRKERGMTQVELAQRAGISPQLLRLVEQSGRISNRTRFLLAMALNVPISKFGGSSIDGKGVEKRLLRDAEMWQAICIELRRRGYTLVPLADRRSDR